MGSNQHTGGYHPLTEAFGIRYWQAKAIRDKLIRKHTKRETKHQEAIRTTDDIMEFINLTNEGMFDIVDE